MILTFKVDPLFNSYLYKKFILKFIENGKKQKFEVQVLNLNKLLKKKSKIPPIFLFYLIICKLKVVISSVPKKKGRSVLRVPFPLRTYQSYLKSIFLFKKGIKVERKVVYLHALLSSIYGLLILNDCFALKLKQFYFETSLSGAPYTFYRWF